MAKKVQHSGQFQPGNPDGRAGRPKGCKNKFTTLKDSFLNVFQQMGGEEALLSWAQKNPGDFFGMIKTMLPKSVEAKVDQTVEVTVIDRFTDSDSDE